MNLVWSSSEFATVCCVDMVGPYRIVERIGEGGMGVVDLGVTGDGQLVAIKTLRAGMIGGTDGRARFEREISAMRTVHGNRVAEVVDADAAADPPYVVTRYVRGLPLSKVVTDHGPLRGDALHRLASGLTEAVSCVHAAGLVHRDIKPANVLLTDDGPVLIDFGLAHAVGETRLTSVGAVTGTIGYIAPEIAYGHDASYASDVHSWAATVAYAATGRSPYGAGPDAVVLDRIRRGDHDTHGVPEPLADLVARGLRVDPAARPTLADIGAALGVEHTVVLAATDAASTTDVTQVVAPDTSATVQSTPRVRPWLPQLAIAVGGLALLALGCVWPYVGAAALFLVIFAGRVAWRLNRRLHERRSHLGRRRSDRVVAVVAAPVDMGASLIPAAVEATLVVAAGYVVGAVLNVLDLTVPGWDLAPFVVGGVVSLTLSWWGPGAEKFRYGVRTLVAPLAYTPRVAWAVAGLFAAAAWTFAVLWERWGTTWWPAGGPVDPFA